MSGGTSTTKTGLNTPSSTSPSKSWKMAAPTSNPACRESHRRHILPEVAIDNSPVWSPQRGRNAGKGAAIGDFAPEGRREHHCNHVQQQPQSEHLKLNLVR